MSKILEVKDLHAFYGKSHILHGVSLDMNEGELVTLLGRNGAGKSTTIRSLMGLMKSMKGSVRMFGREVAGWAPFRIAASGVGYVPEGRRVFPNLTVDENLKVPIERKGPWTPSSCCSTSPRPAWGTRTWTG